MSRPRLLDLFCGAGGAAAGYAAAGFEVVGVDIRPMPRFPFEFHEADALTYPLAGFDVIHASPPCQRYSKSVSRRARATRPDLIAPIRDRLRASGRLYVIENVPGAPLLDPVTYCGSSFGLAVRRHRLFESNVSLVAPPCDHAGQPVVLGVYGTGGPDNRANRPGGGGRKVAGADAAAALGIDWTTDQRRLSQAIPPAYTEHLGRQLLTLLAA